MLLGNKGSIGRRYEAILKNDGIPYLGVDDPNGVKLEHFNFDRLIIATPTRTHLDYCTQAIRLKKPFLCEKPLAETVQEAKEIAQMAQNTGVDGFVVCNWKVMIERIMKNIYAPYRITYDHFHSGNEAMRWNMAQVIYLDPFAAIYNKSPRWNVQVNSIRVKYRQIEHSYVLMIRDFANSHTEGLWSLEDGVKMVERCLEWDKRHGRKFQ